LGDYKEDRHEFQVSRVGRQFNLEDGLIILDLMQKPCNLPKESNNLQRLSSEFIHSFYFLGICKACNTSCMVI